MNDNSEEPRYGLYVPIDEMKTVIDEQAACVGRELDDGHLYIHYESGEGVSNINSFEDRITHAAGRLHERYPTSKMIGGTDETFKKVGTVRKLKSIGWHIEEITDRQALEEWADGPHYEGGSPEIHENARNREMNRKMRMGK